MLSIILIVNGGLEYSGELVIINGIMYQLILIIHNLHRLQLL
nr:MAG TPA: hypothetical protein [Caudoviricetes sp.]